MKSTIERLHTAWKLYRYGIFGILFNKIMQGYIRFRKFILYSFNLKKKPTRPFLKDMSIDIKRIESIQDELFRNFHQKYPAEEFVIRMKKQQVCYVAVQNNEVIAYAWVAFDELFIDAINRPFLLGRDELFIYSCFVDEEHRGSGIYPGMLRKILSDYHDEHMYRRAYIGVISENSGSIRGIKKAGFNDCDNIRYIKFINHEKWQTLGTTFSTATIAE